ncbi:nucleotide kinase domain-containing protein [Phenylobacterium sp.]|uniref:nucleotide kinase domain-containing protein n=1 Tax=Phenylobacterium sp. TaxID=1871053 RepID=UPI004036A928
MTPTCVYDSYWRFAAERQEMYLRRLRGEPAPWTNNPILRAHRFTNVFRASDRVSQYLIREVQYREDRPQAPMELFFRTILFKIFNRISTWELLERELGPLSWQSSDLNRISTILDDAIARGERVYSAAYIMPPPALGHARKHANHLELISKMMNDGLSAAVQRSSSLASVYELLKPYPGLGPFLAFQYAIDLNYSDFLEHGEDDFVVAGPGALDGIAKCFSDVGGRSPNDVIMEMVDRQEAEFERRGLKFGGLFGRRLQPIDCQNLFCEISKYARVAHPEVQGRSGRIRIKQSFSPETRPLRDPMFPPRWGLTPPPAEHANLHPHEQLRLWA